MMPLKAGRCGLIIDGNALEGFSCALDLLAGPKPQTFGFLSGPIDQLKAAQIAKRVEVDFGQGEFTEIRVLQVSNTGIALVAVRDR
jgi:hypothetical protein